MISQLAGKIWWKSWPYRKAYPRTLSKKIRIDLISRFLPADLSGRALDIGCGAGFISGMYSANGIDTRLAQLKWAGNEFKGAKFIAASAEKLPFKNQSFDSVLCIEVIEHLTGLTDLFRELERVTKDDSTLVISTPSMEGLFKPPEVEEHIRDGYYFDEVENELKRHGFKVVEVKYYNKYYGHLMWLLFHYAIHDTERTPAVMKYLISTVQFSPLFPLLYWLYKMDMVLPGKGTGMMIKAEKTGII